MAYFPLLLQTYFPLPLSPSLIDLLLILARCLEFVLLESKAIFLPFKVKVRLGLLLLIRCLRRLFFVAVGVFWLEERIILVVC